MKNTIQIISLVLLFVPQIVTAQTQPQQFDLPTPRGALIKRALSRWIFSWL